MINNKNKIIAAIGLALSGIGFAGTMGPVCIPGNSSIPCAMNAWDLGVEALYLKPVYSARGAYLNNPVETSNYREIANKWGGGFRLEGSYHFNTGNDVSLDWLHYDTTSHFTPYNIYNANRFNRANMVLGQHVDFSQAKSLRFYGGLQYASIQVNQTANNFPVGAPVLQNNNSDFKGVGPIVGVDFAYAIGQSGFSITANTSTSLVYGNSRANLSNMQENPALVTYSVYGNKKTMSSGIEEKLGINYTHYFTQGQLTLNGGYQALNYFNPLSRVTTRVLGSDVAGQIVNSDFGLYGPYFGVHWLGLSSFS